MNRPLPMSERKMCKILENRAPEKSTPSMIHCEVFDHVKTKYGGMESYIDHLKETIDFLSDKNAISEVKTALANIASGEYLTKEDMVFD